MLLEHVQLTFDDNFQVVCRFQPDRKLGILCSMRGLSDDTAVHWTATLAE